MPVDFGPKMQGLASIAGALDRGDLLHAHIATLHLEIPDPPGLAKGAQSATELVALAKELHTSGMLKRDWDPAKHPRWPAGSPDSTGGRFAPGDASADTLLEDESSRSRTAQLAPTIPIPFEAVAPRGGIPLPYEFVPPFGIYPRDLLRNPFPDRPECEEEWREATAYCKELERKGLLGVGDYRGMGRTFRGCVMGQVSAGCGGNPTA